MQKNESPNILDEHEIEILFSFPFADSDKILRELEREENPDETGIEGMMKTLQLDDTESNDEKGRIEQQFNIDIQEVLMTLGKKRAGRGSVGKVQKPVEKTSVAKETVEKQNVQKYMAEKEPGGKFSEEKVGSEKVTILPEEKEKEDVVINLPVKMDDAWINEKPEPIKLLEKTVTNEEKVEEKIPFPDRTNFETMMARKGLLKKKRKIPRKPLTTSEQIRLKKLHDKQHKAIRKRLKRNVQKNEEVVITWSDLVESREKNLKGDAPENAVRPITKRKKSERELKDDEFRNKIEMALKKRKDNKIINMDPPSNQVNMEMDDVLRSVMDDAVPGVTFGKRNRCSRCGALINIRLTNRCFSCKQTVIK